MDYEFFCDSAFRVAMEDLCAEKKCSYIDPKTVAELSVSLAESISDLAFFNNLEVLYLTTGNFKNLSVLKKLKNLRELYLFDNAIDDMSDMWELGQLTGFGLDCCYDITLITKFKHLKKMTLVYADENDFTPLGNLADMEDLTLQASNIHDINFVSKMKRLKKINFKRNFICDISPLSLLEELEAVIISDNYIADISPLKQLSSIRHLDISNNPIRMELCALNDMSCIYTLTQLDVYGIPTDKETFSRAADLTKLRMGGDKCDDISFLPRYDSLEELSLYNSRVWDISCLYEMSKLRSLWLVGNEWIEDITPAYMLKDCGVEVYMSR